MLGSNQRPLPCESDQDDFVLFADAAGKCLHPLYLLASDAEKRVGQSRSQTGLAGASKDPPRTRA